jgi:hypothetical protein
MLAKSRVTDVKADDNVPQRDESLPKLVVKGMLKCY